MIGRFRSVLCVSVFQGSTFRIVIIIDGSEKRNCEGSFWTSEFVCEKLSSTLYIKRDFLVALKAIRSLLFSTIVLVFFISPALYHRNVLVTSYKKIKNGPR